MTRRPALSIVTTAYRSEAYLEEFHFRAASAAREVTDDYEILIVNDGSPDASLERAIQIGARDPRVRVIDLSRNFGHHKAMMTGLAHARGDLVFLLDSDLEEDPMWLGRFREKLAGSGADVVYGVQARRKGSLVERVAGAIFFRLADWLLATPVPRNLTTARLMTRRYVEQLVRHRDQEVFIAGLWAITGFDQQPLVVDKGSRGSSSYSARRRLSVLANSVTSFSNRPLIYIFYLGASIVTLAALVAAGLIGYWLVSGIGVPGWLSLIVSVWFLGGLTIFSLGVIGVYLAKVFVETKDRPYTVVRAVYPPEGEE